MSAPTLINLPPPISEPVTPTETGPGTPNSSTTAVSELSTVAIKDGHRGHLPNHWHNRQHASAPHSVDTLEAERADRISRLAGLERVTAPHQGSNSNSQSGGNSLLQPGAQGGYFDASGLPQYAKERSTVGSASATGSVGGRTTWASGSDNYDQTDKMSEDMDTSSTGGFSDEGNASLVGFGEGASSTVSGPISTAQGIRTPQRQSFGPGSPYIAKGGGIAAPGTAHPPQSQVSSVPATAATMDNNNQGNVDREMSDVDK